MVKKIGCNLKLVSQEDEYINALLANMDDGSHQDDGYYLNYNFRWWRAEHPAAQMLAAGNKDIMA